MADPLSPKPPAKIGDSLITQSSVNADTNYYPASGDADEVDVSSFLAPPQGEGELGRLERYRILKELGRGGMGMVLMGEDSRLHRMAAIKIMLPKYARDSAARERFLREARAAAKIKHDNVVRIHQVDETNGIPFIAMEFLKGAPLDQHLKDSGELPIGQTLRIGREMAEGLQAAHAEGLIHRDIKPANVWLEAPKGRVKILDFGLAREERDDTNLTKSGAIVGTPAYMSPEQAHGRAIDGRSDLFSLGVVLYRLCSGKQPFTGPNTMAVLMALGTETPPPVRQLNPNVPAALDQLIQRLMAKDRDQRPGSAEEVVAALSAIENPGGSGIPEVVYVVTSPTVVVDDPFANIDETSFEIPATRPAPVSRDAKALRSGARAPDTSNDTDRSKKPNSRRLLLAGLGGVLAIAIAFIIIKITNKDGSVTELKVPDGSKVEVVDKGKTIVVVDPKSKKDPIVKVEPKKADPVNPPTFVPPTFEEREAKKQQEEWAAKLKLPVEATNKLGMKMILIPPAGAALPKAYYLGKYEVTQGEWEKVMGYNPSIFGPKNAKVASEDTSKFPVDNVSWYDSVEFCNKLSEQEGLKPYYDLKVAKRDRYVGKHVEEAEVKILGGSGYHLPTDAEWTWGCATGAKTKFHFGNNEEDLLAYAWFDKNSEGRTHAVGEKKPNAFGLFDMHGNAREWNEEMLSNATTGAPERVACGGAWSNTAGDCAVSSRHRVGPASCSHSYGLRLARVPTSEPPVNPQPYFPPTYDEIEAKKQQEDWATKLKLPVEATSKIGVKMILIPPAGAALPKAYYLGKYEVTQGEWEKVMGYNPSGFSATGKDKAKIAGMDTSKFPVESVSWFDSVEFCNKLSEQEDLKPYYDLKVTKRGGKDSKQIEEAEVKILGGSGYRIPTDAEWTCGCAAGAKTTYHFGDKDNDLPEYAWFKDNSEGRTHGVGEKKPNAFGLHDMHGNVLEWNEEMLSKATGAPERVYRGGDWLISASTCAVSHRHRTGPTSHSNSNRAGLRVARVPTSEAPVNPPPFVPPTFDEKEAKKQQEEWATKLKLPVEATNKIGMKMILIPPTGAALPKAYYLGKYEVTQGEWEKVMDYNPSFFGPKNPKVAGMDTSKFPVDMVNWFDSVEFCNKLSEQEGLQPYYDLKVTKWAGKGSKQIDEAEVKILGGNGYHIPTDAEWTHGCAAGAKTIYHFGDKYEDLLEYAWFVKNSEGRTHTAGEKKPNAFGLHDMHGNVWEWNEEMLANSTTGAAERVIRGGNWPGLAGSCAVSTRGGYGPGTRINSVGLRVARVP